MECGLNYVIKCNQPLTLDYYLMWDFTSTCISYNLPLTCKSLSFCGLLDLFVGHKQVLLAPSCQWAFPFRSTSSIGLLYAIYENHMSTPYTHLWESVNMYIFMGTSCMSWYNTIGNTSLLGHFWSSSLCGLYGIALCNAHTTSLIQL